mmetsp:Transcript_8381/g.21401  ORF Transcript_8381/g.21401 Transcript_8381/m.21401 type:complete len:250 (+) Transcript_8381:779-1528(+)
MLLSQAARKFRACPSNSTSNSRKKRSSARSSCFSMPCSASSAESCPLPNSLASHVRVCTSSSRSLVACRAWPHFAKCSRTEASDSLWPSSADAISPRAPLSLALRASCPCSAAPSRRSAFSHASLVSMILVFTSRVLRSQAARIDAALSSVTASRLATWHPTELRNASERPTYSRPSTDMCSLAAFVQLSTRCSVSSCNLMTPAAPASFTATSWVQLFSSLVRSPVVSDWSLRTSRSNSSERSESQPLG